MNIFSGEAGLAGALTNPTELARSKGSITRAYPVRVAGKLYPDAETAYQHLKTRNEQDDDDLMARIIASKFRQHDLLFKAVTKRGGAEFLKRCSHFTGAKSEGFRSWEGEGLQSRFIRNLVVGYELAASGEDIVFSAQGALW